jgi:hypothetical protein
MLFSISGCSTFKYFSEISFNDLQQNTSLLASNRKEKPIDLPTPTDDPNDSNHIINSNGKKSLLPPLPTPTPVSAIKS